MTLFRSWQIVLTCKVTCPSAGARSSRAMTSCTNGETFCSGSCIGSYVLYTGRPKVNLQRSSSLRSQSQKFRVPVALAVPGAPGACRCPFGVATAELVLASRQRSSSLAIATYYDCGLFK